MKQKGFTLLELLAVIAVLAILALIITPITLKVIEDSERQSGMKSFKLYLHAVDLAIAKTNMDGNLTDAICTVQAGGNLNCHGDYVEVDIKNRKEIKSGTILIEDRDVVEVRRLRIGDYEYNLGIDGKIVANKIKQSAAKPCIVDRDENGEAIITCGTESFYVISSDTNTVTMLAKYNLDVGYIYEAEFGDTDKLSYKNNKNLVATPTDLAEGLTLIQNPTGIQSSSARGIMGKANQYYGVLPFSETNYWVSDASKTNSINKRLDATPLAGVAVSYQYVYDQNSTLYQYVENYEQYLKNHKVKSAEARLMSRGEASSAFTRVTVVQSFEKTDSNNQLGATPLAKSSSAGVAKLNSWVSSSSYWLGSASDIDKLFVINYNDHNIHSAPYDNYHDYGVRPVVTVSRSEIDGEIS